MPRSKGAPVDPGATKAEAKPKKSAAAKAKAGAESAVKTAIRKTASAVRKALDKALPPVAAAKPKAGGRATKVAGKVTAAPKATKAVKAKASATKATSAKKPAVAKSRAASLRKSEPGKAVPRKTTVTKGAVKSPARRTVLGATKKAAVATVFAEPQIKPESEITAVSATETEEHYFHRHEHLPHPTPMERELPTEYGDTKIVLLVRDPEWVYAYWEINDATRAELKLPRDGHSRRMILRVYKISGRNWPEESAHYFFDVDVSPYANNWYVHMPEVSERWCAEVGFFDEEGNYIAIARSNVISTPRDSISNETDAHWMAVEETFQKLYGVNGPRGMREMQLRGGSEALIRQLEKQVFPMLRGESLSSGMFSGSQSAIPVAVAEKDFWLQVHMEVILYGATEKTAKVRVNDRPVRLNPDGTFSMRFALPDGEHALHVQAVNQDGDMEREVTPVVTKITR